jgi:MFS family permease
LTVQIRPTGLRRFIGQTGRAPVPREPDFWRLWVVGTVLYCVRWTEMIAFAIFVYQQTSSPLLVAVITMLRSLPMSMLGVFLGALTDKLDRRTALLIVLAMLFATSCALGFLSHMKWLAVWHLAAASFLNGINWAADNPVRRVLIGEVVGLARINTAMSIDAGTNQASRVVGPAMGGALLATFGLEGVFVLNAALVAIAFVAALTVRYRNTVAHIHVGGILARMFEGVKAARNDIRLRGALLITVIFNMFGWPCLSMVPVIGKDSFQLGASGVGLLASMEGLGAVLGVFAITFLARSGQYATLYVGGLLVQHTLLIAFAFSPNALIAGVLLLLTGFAAAGFTITQAALIYRMTPPEMRGRILGLLSVCIGVGPLGFMQVGVLANVFGAKWAIVVVALIGLVVMALLRRQWLPLLRADENTA